MGLFFLRCKQINLTLEELNLLEEGEVMDMIVESSNDGATYQEKGTRASFEAMFGGH